MKVVLVDCLIYQGYCYQRRRAAGSPDRDEPITTRMKRAPCTGHLYPGEMDRYADRLDSAAGEADKAKTRPDDDEDEQDDA
jgi:hypothetical protein